MRAATLGVTDFSEIIKLQFGRKRHTLLCILRLFRIIVAYLSLKKTSLLAEALFLVFVDGGKETSAMGRKWLY